MTPFYPTTQKPKNVEPRRKITVTMIRQRPQAQQARRHGHPLHPLQHEQQQQQKQQNHQQNHEQNQQQHPQQQYSEGQDTQKVYWQDDNDDHHVVVNMRDYEQRQRRITTRPQSPPTMIPDKDYKYFLAGTTRPRTTAMCTPHGVAKGCSYISLVGMIFLLWVHMLIERQPIFIQGIAPKNIAYTSPDYKHQLLPASASALYAALAYAVTCIGCFVYTYNLCHHRRQLYKDIPDADSVIPVFHTHEPYQPPSRCKSILSKVHQTWKPGGTPSKKRRGVWNKDM